MNNKAISKYILGCTIALLPVFNRVSEYDMGRTSKDNLLMFIMLILSVLMEKKRELDAVYKYLGVAFIAAMSIHQWNVASVNVIVMGFYGAISLMFLIKLYEGIDVEDKEFYLDSMAVGAIIQSIFVIFELMGFDLLYIVYAPFVPNLTRKILTPSYFFNMSGTLGNSNLLSAYLCLTSLTIFRKKFIWFTPLVFTTFISSGAIMGIASFIAGVLYYFTRKHELISKKVIYGASILGMLILPIVGVGGQDSGRFGIWEKILSYHNADSFFIGKGLGWYPDLQMKFATGIVVQEHNEYLATFNAFGIIGVFVLLFFIYKKTITKGKDILLEAIIFSSFCNSYGHFSYHQSTTTIIMITIIALYCADTRGSNGFDMERTGFANILSKKVRV